MTYSRSHSRWGITLIFERIWFVSFAFQTIYPVRGIRDFLHCVLQWISEWNPEIYQNIFPLIPSRSIIMIIPTPHFNPANLDLESRRPGSACHKPGQIWEWQRSSTSFIKPWFRWLRLIVPWEGPLPGLQKSPQLYSRRRRSPLVRREWRKWQPLLSCGNGERTAALQWEGGPSKANGVNLIKISLLGSYRWQPHHQDRIYGLITCILLNQLLKKLKWNKWRSFTDDLCFRRSYRN
jgi:hypothetical protein